MEIEVWTVDVVQQVLREQQALPEQRELQVLREQPEQPEQPELLVVPEPRELPELPEQQVLLGLQVQLVLRALLELQVLRDRLVIVMLQIHQILLIYLHYHNIF